MDKINCCEKFSFKKTIPVRKSIDVFVAGGGPAGIAAAIAAARHNVSVYLAESQSCFGGMSTAGMIPSFCQFANGIDFVASGIGKEVYDKMFALGGNGPDDDYNNPYKILSINAEVLKRIYDNLISDAGIEFTFQTNLIDVIVQNNKVQYAICSSKSGIFAVKAKVYIDCTGDGDLAAWAGASFEKGNEHGDMQPGTLCSLWSDINWKTLKKMGSRPYERQTLQQAIKDGVFTAPDPHLPGMYHIGNDIGGGNIGHAFRLDGTEDHSITQALIQSRKALPEYERFYKEYVKGCEKTKLIATAALLGVRESRRILGDYTLCLDDFKNRAIFDDEIGRYCYAVDMHPSKADAKNYADFEKQMKTFKYAAGESYGIPYRCLIPKKLDNVLIAGRCVSSDRYMQSSIRVMPGCFITGQATGVAAAIASSQNKNTRNINLHLLQQKLKKLEAYLPNSK